MQLVLQGPILPETEDIVRSYLELEFVERIVVSCWETCPQLSIRSHRVLVLHNSPVEFPSTGNLNRQLLSSAEGLRHVTADYAAKLRTDQKLSLSSLRMMDEFFWRFRSGGARYVDGSGPQARIFVLGNYTRFPFHPRDHVFWGHTADLRRLFDIPHSATPWSKAPDYTRVLRPEAWIGMHYFARFHPAVRDMVKSPETYLVDQAPRLREALAIDEALREQVFKVFPRIDLEWRKHNLQSYHYHVGQSFSEYWHDQPWR
jgi:hypothetical protein